MSEKIPLPQEAITQPVDTQRKEGDFRKTAFVMALMRRHPEALEIYEDFGLMKKITIPDEETAEKDKKWGHTVRKIGERRKRREHFAPEHMVTVIAGVQSLGQLLQKHGYLSEKEVFQIEKSAAIHDAGKELESSLVNAALKNNVILEEYQKILNKIETRITDKKVFSKIVEKYAPQMRVEITKGIRAQAAYDLAGDINGLRLKEKGIPPELLKIQKMVGHASCPKIEKIADSFQSLKDDEKRQAIQFLAMYYMDDIVTNPNIINPAITEGPNGEKLNALDRRCLQNEMNPKYKEFNMAWKQDPRNKTGETAFATQRRIGHKVEKILADLLRIENPLTLPEIIDENIKNNIVGKWQDLQKSKNESKP